MEIEQLKNTIAELNKRIEYLEKKELKRTRKKQIQIALNIIKILAIVTIIFIIYTNINNKIIKPYKEKMEYVEEKIDYVEEKANNIETYIKEKIELIQKYIPIKKNN